MIGTGSQLVFLSFIVILYIILGDLYLERSLILTSSIFLYAITSTLSGYVSGSFYARYSGKNWVHAMILTSLLLPAVFSISAICVNLVAIYQTLSRAIPIGTMIAVLCIWLFLVFPLTLIGAVVGRNFAGAGNFPCRINPIPRPIPEKRWYANSLMFIVMGGILPFSSIFIECHFIFTSFWSPNKTYYVYGFMLLVFIILLSVTVCVSIVSTCIFN